jgi:hypothetical protein
MTYCKHCVFGSSLHLAPELLREAHLKQVSRHAYLSMALIYAATVE